MITNPDSMTRLLEVHPTKKDTAKRRAPITISATPLYCLNIIITVN